jgi:hypothetical protein
MTAPTRTLYRRILEHNEKLNAKQARILLGRLRAAGDDSTLALLAVRRIPAPVRRDMVAHDAHRPNVRWMLLCRGDLSDDEIRALVNGPAAPLEHAADEATDGRVLAALAGAVDGPRGVRGGLLRKLVSNPACPINNVVSLLERRKDSSAHLGDLEAFARYRQTDDRMAAVMQATTLPDELLDALVNDRRPHTPQQIGAKTLAAYLSSIGDARAVRRLLDAGRDGATPRLQVGVAGVLSRALMNGQRGSAMARSVQPLADALALAGDEQAVDEAVLAGWVTHLLDIQESDIDDPIDSAALAVTIATSRDETEIARIVNIVKNRTCDEQLIAAAGLHNTALTYQQVSELASWASDEAITLMGHTDDPVRAAGLVRGCRDALGASHIKAGLSQVMAALDDHDDLDWGHYDTILGRSDVTASAIAMMPAHKLSGGTDPSPAVLDALNELLGEDEARWTLLEAMAEDSESATIGELAATVALIADLKT